MERRSDGTYIKKGPWTAEEDEILMNFVNKYGPRDWSSIRSKGLLPRTGKSCRLRWVNKLRPNLKTCKFTAEEERVVIELQAQFGNKWAKIATYLPGRTDNDVKNFWSTRRKRLERMLKNPSPKWQRNNKGKNSDIVHDQLPFLEVPESSSIPVEESPTFGAESEDLKMLPMPNLVLSPSFPDLGATSLPALDATPILHDSHNYPFALLPPQPQLDITLLPECSGLAAEPGDDYFFDKFDSMGASKSGSDHSILTSELQLVAEGNVVGRREGQDMENPSTPDSFFDDFPADMFDYLEPLPSPSEW